MAKIPFNCNIKKMKPYKQLAGQTLVYGLGTIVPRLLNYLLLTPFYTYVVADLSGYGVISEIYSYIAFLMVLLTYGMETTYFRFSVDDNYNKNQIFNTSFFSLLITTSIFLIIVFTNVSGISKLIHYESNSQYIIWFSLIVAFDAITAIPFAKLRQENKAIKFAIIKIGNILINIGFNLFFFLVCKNAESGWLSNIYNEDIGVGYAFLSNLFASIFSFLVLIPELKYFKFNINFSVYKKMISYALPLLIVGLSGMVNEVADKILIKYITPEHLKPMEQLGIYSANYKLAVLMTIFIQMFKYAAEPFFFNQAKNIDAKQIYAKVMTYFVIFCLLIFLLVTLYIDIFKYFIGKPFRVGIGVVPIVLLANMFLGIYYNLSVWYKLTNLTRYGALIAIVGVIITFFINIVFIPKYGYLASAWATFICYFIMMIISYFMGKKYYKINYNIKKIIIYIILAIILFLIYNYFKINMLYNIITSTILFFIFVFIVIKAEKIKLSDLMGILKK